MMNLVQNNPKAAIVKIRYIDDKSAEDAVCGTFQDASDKDIKISNYIKGRYYMKETKNIDVLCNPQKTSSLRINFAPNIELLTLLLTRIAFTFSIVHQVQAMPYNILTTLNAPSAMNWLEKNKIKKRWIFGFFLLIYALSRVEQMFMTDFLQGVRLPDVWQFISNFNSRNDTPLPPTQDTTAVESVLSGLMSKEAATVVTGVVAACGLVGFFGTSTLNLFP